MVLTVLMVLMSLKPVSEFLHSGIYILSDDPLDQGHPLELLPVPQRQII